GEPAFAGAPEAAQLRRFGLAAAVLLVLAAIALVDGVWVSAAAIPAGLLAVAAHRRPAALAALYRGWMRVARTAGRVNTIVLLAMVFFVVLTPTGLLLRLVRYDPMRRRPVPSASYRVARTARAPDHLYRQF
ncbi:MAG TPA: SxtJ family membrane protein, partial [Vicinamibacterales bacterium]|nr:SxtJ family membrane protein [Vicinamibacterales bacterium]